MLFKNKIYALAFLAFALSCNSETKKENSASTESTAQTALVKAPNFSADLAYLLVEKQVNFGPRVPNTAAHVKCGDWMAAELKANGFEVTEQKFKATTYDGKALNARNIIGSYNPNATKRILLAAHWDSRPFADKDTVNQNKPIDAANDGASGVGVLLELARTINNAATKPNVGIDIIFFDAEDWGAPHTYTGKTDDYGGYCLGSSYWSKNLHKPNYSAFYGVLLDMVGAKGATFMQEDGSMQIAPSVVNNIWGLAGQLGYSQYFVPEKGAGLTDDHVPVYMNAKIPMIDIIDLRKTENTFFEYHHTHGDNMKTIDKTTLKAVGQTLVQMLYQESN